MSIREEYCYAINPISSLLQSLPMYNVKFLYVCAAIDAIVLLKKGNLYAGITIASFFNGICIIF